MCTVRLLVVAPLAVPFAFAAAAAQLPTPVGASEGAIQVDSLERAGIFTLSDLLNSRVPGVMVQLSSGTVGSGARISIRGVSTIQLAATPLIVVDGVQVDGTTGASSLPGGNQSSRLDDLAIDDIERIEVLHGAAGASLYGMGSARGVLLITTKHGAAGAPHWTMHGELGRTMDVSSYPANYARFDGTERSCTLDREAARECVPDASGLHSFNPLERYPAFKAGLVRALTTNVNGGGRRGTYYLSAGYRGDEGVQIVDRDRRLDARANARLALGKNVSVDLTSGYVERFIGVPTRIDPLLAGLYGQAVDDANHGYADLRAGLGTRVSSDNAEQNVRRFIGGLRTDWRMGEHWRLNASVGADRLSRADTSYFANTAGSSVIFQSHAGAFNNTSYTAESHLTASYSIGAWGRSSSRAGVRYAAEHVHDDLDDRAGYLGQPEGLRSSHTSQLRIDGSDKGAFVQQTLALWDHLLLDGSLRRGQSEIFLTAGPTVANYPAASASWNIVHDHGTWLTSLRVRGAYGEASDRMRYSEVDRNPDAAFFSDLAVLAQRPSHTREREAGIDAVIAKRVRVAVTGYRKTTVTPLYRDPAWQFSFYIPEHSIENRGVEGTLGLEIARTRRVTWDLTLTGSENRNRLRAPIRTYVSRNIFDPLAYRNVDGYPVWGVWGRPIVSATDQNGDGRIIGGNCPPGQPAPPGRQCEVVLGADSVYLGSTMPPREFSLASRLTLLHAITLTALVDRRSGFRQVNFTELARCLDGICRAANDPSSPLPDQARRIAALLGGASGYVEDASFWKLREVAIAFAVSPRWTERLRVRNANVTLAARNLATWTNYSGLDPELNSGGQLTQYSIDNFTAAPIRYYTARVTIDW